MTDQPTDSGAVLDALERLLRHSELASAPRLAAFLRYVVTETLEGRASHIKAFSIATSVFGRDKNFDPQTNPLVRVEATRLRQALSHYYATAGQMDPVEIRLDRGSYVPEFIERPLAATPVTPSALPHASAGMSRYAMMAAVGGICLAVGLMAGLVLRGPFGASPDAPAARTSLTSQTTETPTISVRIVPVTADAAARALADQLNRQIEAALSRFDFPIVVQQPVLQPTYLLTGSMRSKPQGDSILDVTINHAPSGTLVWAREFETGAASGSAPGEIAAQVAHTYGVLYSDIRKRIAEGATFAPAFECVVKARAALAGGEDAPRAEAQACLAAAVKTHRNFSPALTARAFLTTARYLDVASPELTSAVLDEAADDARQAVALTPHQARPHTALFWTRLLLGRFEDAFESAQVALELNPNSAETRARIGAGHIMRGRYDEGAAMLRQVARMGWSPGWQDFYLFLAAEMRGNTEAATRHAQRKGALASPLGHIANVILAGRSGDPARVKEARKAFGMQFPGFAANPAAALERYPMTPEIRARLLQGYGV